MTPAFMLWPLPADDEFDVDDPLVYKIDTWHPLECAMCGTVGPTVIDHDHDTGLTRGLLCRSCNVREGRSSEPHWQAWRAGGNPARIFGIEEDYQTAFTTTDRSNMPWTSDPEVMRRGAEAAGRIG